MSNRRRAHADKFGDVVWGCIQAHMAKMSSLPGQVDRPSLHMRFFPISTQQTMGGHTRSLILTCQGELWYLSGKWDDVLKPDWEIYLKELLAKPIEPVVALKESFMQQVLFKAWYEVKQISATAISVKDRNDFVVALTFPIGDICAAAGSFLIGHVSGEVPCSIRNTDGGQLAGVEQSCFDGSNTKVIWITLFYSLTEDVVKLQKLEDGTEQTQFEFLRVFLKGDEVYPVPGEMITLGIVAMPNHPWLAQKTNPFSYAGNWFETGFYTSGIVLSITPADSGLENDNVYTIRVREDELVDIISSDFAGYVVDERVCLLKNHAGVTENFIESGVVTGHDYKILPICFYKEII